MANRRAFLGAAAALAGVARIGAVAAAPERLGFSELYESFGVLGFEFGTRAKALVGSAVAMRGYVAPPLKAESDFFVLTREPMALCPFCQSDADWPVDIVVVYLRKALATFDPNKRIDVAGRLELGSWRDPDTGFVSMIRLRESAPIGA